MKKILCIGSSYGGENLIDILGGGLVADAKSLKEAERGLRKEEYSIILIHKRQSNEDSENILKRVREGGYPLNRNPIIISLYYAPSPVSQWTDKEEIEGAVAYLREPPIFFQGADKTFRKDLMDVLEQHLPEYVDSASRIQHQRSKRKDVIKIARRLEKGASAIKKRARRIREVVDSCKYQGIGSAKSFEYLSNPNNPNPDLAYYGEIVHGETFRYFAERGDPLCKAIVDQATELLEQDRSHGVNFLDPFGYLAYQCSSLVNHIIRRDLTEGEYNGFLESRIPINATRFADNEGGWDHWKRNYGLKGGGDLKPIFLKQEKPLDIKSEDREGIIC